MSTTIQAATFREAWKAWKAHECDSPTDVCECTVAYSCPGCGRETQVHGEDLPMLNLHLGGLCPACLREGT